ncbi:MAG TPA: hypothetical protein VH538_03365 [Gaiellaceae bacterium]
MPAPRPHAVQRAGGRGAAFDQEAGDEAAGPPFPAAAVHVHGPALEQLVHRGERAPHPLLGRRREVTEADASVLELRTRAPVVAPALFLLGQVDGRGDPGRDERLGFPVVGIRPGEQAPGLDPVRALDGSGPRAQVR